MLLKNMDANDWFCIHMTHFMSKILACVVLLFIVGGCAYIDGSPLATPTQMQFTQPTAFSTIPPPLSITPTPFLLGLFSSQAERINNIYVELLPNTDYSDVILRITRNDKDVQELSLKAAIGSTILGNVRLLALRDLDLDGEVEIVLDIFTRGTNCCTVIAVVYYDPDSQQYQSSNQLITNWGLSPQMVDIDEDDIPEFVTRDSSYPWIASAAAAISPIQIFRYVSSQIIDITSEYPDLLEQDARLWLAAAQGQVINLDEDYVILMQEDSEYWANVGEIELIALSTYLADMYLLGKEDEGWKKIYEICQDDLCKEYFDWLQKVFSSK